MDHCECKSVCHTHTKIDTHRGIGALWTHISMHINATGDFKNIGPKAITHKTLWIDGEQWEERYWFCNEQIVINTNVFLLKIPVWQAVIHPLSLIIWEILLWPDMWFKKNKTPNGTSPWADTCIFIPYIDRGHVLITELQEVLIARHIPWLLWFISHIQGMRINPFPRLCQRLIDDGPLQLVLTVIRRLVKSGQ